MASGRDTISPQQSGGTVDPDSGKGPGRRPTLREVARAADVSVTTASNVINRKFDLMSLETRRRVEEAIRDLDYRVNAMGRSLRSAQGKAVAFIALDDDVSFLRDPYTALSVSGFANAVADAGFNPIINRIDPSRIEEHSLFSTDDVVGLCMSLQGWARERSRAVTRLASLHLPMVLIENRPPPDVKDVCAVMQDDFGGSVMLAHHLARKGAKAILLVRQAVDWASIEGREAGIRTVFAPPERRMDRLDIDHLSLVADVDRKLTRFLGEAPMPDAIMCGNDQIAAACIKVLLRMGKRVPQDIAVTGYNGFDVFDVLPYRLTTIHSPAYDLGFRAGQELVQRVRGGSFKSAEILLSVSMQLGETT